MTFTRWPGFGSHWFPKWKCGPFDIDSHPLFHHQFFFLSFLSFFHSFSSLVLVGFRSFFFCFFCFAFLASSPQFLARHEPLTPIVNFFSFGVLFSAPKKATVSVVFGRYMNSHLSIYLRLSSEATIFHYKYKCDGVYVCVSSTDVEASVSAISNGNLPTQCFPRFLVMRRQATNRYRTLKGPDGWMDVVKHWDYMKIARTKGREIVLSILRV